MLLLNNTDVAGVLTMEITMKALEKPAAAVSDPLALAAAATETSMR